MFRDLLRKTTVCVLVCMITVLPSNSMIYANIIIDPAGANTDQGAGDYTVSANITHTTVGGESNGIYVNTTGGGAGTLTVNNGVTVDSSTGDTINIQEGATLAELNNQGTISRSATLNNTIENNGTITTVTNAGTLSSDVGTTFWNSTGVIGTLVNSGTIQQTGVVSDETALFVNNATTVTNTSTGTIQSGIRAVYIGTQNANNTVGTFTNDGTILTTSADGARRAMIINTFGGGTTTVTSFVNNGSITAANGAMGLQIANTGGGTVTVGFTNGSSGTISAAGDALVLGNGAEFSSFTNNNIITSSGAAKAGFLVQEDTDIAITNAGTIRNTAGGNALKFDTEAQTSNDFTNAGTVSSATGTAINADVAVTGSANGFINTGTVTGGGGTAIDAEAAFKLNNSGTVTGAIDHATAGALTVTNSGTITGAITSTANAAHSFSQTAGSTTGNITLDGTTGNALSLDGGTITGTIDLGNGATHTVTLSGGTIAGVLDLGDTAGTTATIDAASGTTMTFSNTGSTALMGEQSTINITGAGKLLITGNIVDTTGGDNDLTLDVDAGEVEFSETSSIDGGIDADGGTVDLQTNTLTIKNTTDFASGVTIASTINNASIGNISNGAANIGITVHDGAIVSLSANNTQAGTAYTLIDATGAGAGTNLSATAANITISETSSRYAFALSKSADKLLITPSLAGGNDHPEVDAQADGGLSGDSTIYNALNNTSSTSDLNTALESLEPDTDTIKTSTMALQMQALQPVENRIYGFQREGIAAGDSPMVTGIWAQGFYENANQNDTQEAHGYASDMTGFALGFDREWDNEIATTLLGVAYSKVWADIDVNHVKDQIDIDGHLFTGYASYEKDNMVIDMKATYGLNFYEGSRNIAVGSVKRIAHSDFDGHQCTLDGDIGYRIEKNEYTILPKIGLKHMLLYTDSYKESGAGSANLNIDSDTYNKLYGTCNVTAEKTYAAAHMLWSPKLKTGFMYDFLDEDVSTTAAFQGGGSSFSVKGLKAERYMVSCGAELTVAKNENLEFNIAYDFSWNKEYYSNYFAAKVRYEF